MEIIEIAKKIERAGGRLYLVGGAVRDKLLGKNYFDEDYCVTGLEEKIFRSLFPEAKIQGKAFQVFVLDKKEFAMARKERKCGVGHQSFEIKTGKEISIEEDLKRRDITINSMAEDVLTGEIIDPFGGKEDLKKRMIRATSKHFKEDPLRVYRVARFSSQLDFMVEEETIKEMKKLKDELRELSKERVFMEFKKALAGEKPSNFFNVLRKAEVLEVHFRSVYDLIGALQPEKYHPEGDSYNHTMQCLDACVSMTEDVKIRFSVLVHDLGKGRTPKEEYPHHYGHEDRGVKVVEEMAKELALPKAWEKCGKVACKEHMRGGIFSKIKPAKKVEFIERVDKSYLGLAGLQIVVNCDKINNPSKEKEEYNFLHVGTKCLKEVNAKKVAEKYQIKEGVTLGNKLHEERVKWMKSLTN